MTYQADQSTLHSQLTHLLETMTDFRPGFALSTRLPRYASVEYQPPSGTVIDYRLNFTPAKFGITYQVDVIRYQGYV